MFKPKRLLFLLLMTLAAFLLLARPVCDTTTPELYLCSWLGSYECMECLGQRKEREGEFQDAIDWYYKAVAKGSMRSMIGLGNLYRDGKGVLMDKAEALKWYEKAAAKTDNDRPDLYLAIGLMLRKGEAGYADAIEGTKWVMKAADAGSMQATALIGLYYAGGDGLPFDPIEAYAWLTFASALLPDSPLKADVDSKLASVSADLTTEGKAEAASRYNALSTERLRKLVLSE